MIQQKNNVMLKKKNNKIEKPLPPMNVIANGYSGYCKLTINKNNDKTSIYALLKSFSVSVETNIIQSSAVNKIYKGGNFRKLGLNAVRDYPTFTIQLSFQCNLTFFAKIMQEMQGGFQNPFEIFFKDNAYGYQYVFSNSFVTSLSVNVSSDSDCYLDMGFAYFSSSFYFASSQFNKNYTTGGIYSEHPEIAKLMPYYGWGVEFGGFNQSNLLSFSFNFERGVIPKFGCTGESSKKIIAIDPIKKFFALPIVTFTLSYLYQNHSTSNDYTTSSNDCLNKTLTIKRQGASAVSFTKCVINNYTPNLVNEGSYNTIDISGSVLGEIIVSKTSV